MFRSALFFLLFLGGCSTYEYHGHYKFDEKKIANGMKKDQVIEEFGIPLYMPFSKNVMYYFYSKNLRNSFGFDRICDAQILRIELEDGVIVSHEMFEFTDYKADKETTKAPYIKMNIFSELMDGIENATTMEEAVKQSRSFISMDNNSSSS